MKSLLVLSLFLSTSVMANQADINTIETAYQQFNGKALIEVASKNEPYIKAFAHYRLSLINNIHAKKADAITSLNLTIKELESIVEVNKENDEAWALLGQSYGLMISYNPTLAMTYGQKSFDAIEQAIQIDPTNPRAMLFKGIISFNTPENYGGDKLEAITALNTAIELFNDDRYSEHYWGEAEAYVWRGLSFQALHNIDEANADFTKALEIEPHLEWAKFLLKNNT